MRGWTQRLGLLIGGLLVAGPAASDPLALPLLSLTPENGSIRVVARVEGSSVADVTARLEVRKADDAGSVGTAQESRLTLTPGVAMDVANVTVSLVGAGSLTATLSVSQSGDIVASTSTTLTQSQNKE